MFKAPDISDRFLIVQWIFGNITIGNQGIFSPAANLSSDNMQASYTKWTIDTWQSQSPFAEYTDLEKGTPNEIVSKDTPGGGAPPGQTINVHLSFKLNAYNISDFGFFSGNPTLKNSYQDPDNPKPVLSIPWDFNGSYTFPNPE